jgi:hypothetical protein
MNNYEPYVRGRGMTYEAIQYANKLIKSENINQDLQTLKCYHEIVSGQRRNEMSYMPQHKIDEIKHWCDNVRIAFEL